jgi:hypothetical protein
MSLIGLLFAVVIAIVAFWLLSYITASALAALLAFAIFIALIFGGVSA